MAHLTLTANRRVRSPLRLTAALLVMAGLAAALGAGWVGEARAAEPSLATKLSPEERLDAIRNGLVQAALEGATRVESVAWLDGEGRLHESSSFRSGMQVRGVQVLSYVRDREGQPQAHLKLPAAAEPRAIQNANANAAPARRDLQKESASRPASAASAAPCARADGLRHLIGLDLSVAGNWPAHDAPLAHALAELLSTAWLQSDSSANWRMLAEPAAHDAARSAYEQAMLGTGNAALPWQIQVLVLPGPPAVAEGFAALPQWLTGQGPSPTARITLSLQARGQARPQLSLSAELPLLREASQWGAPQLSPAGRAQVQALLVQWRQALSAPLACEPVRPTVLPVAGALLRMNAGALAGVQAGEEWLLADPQAFPERLLAPGVTQQLMLAKVLKVHARHADMQIVAGPARPAVPTPAAWRAWRAESPLGD